MRPYIAFFLLFAALAAVPAAEAQRPRPEDRARAEAQRRGWLGFSYSDRENDGSLLVLEVLPGSPAERAGLREGDRIVRWNDRADPLEIATGTVLQPGDEVRLRVRREGERDRDLVVTAGERPRDLVQMRRGPGGDVIVIDPGPLAERFRWYGDNLRVHLDSMALHADSLHSRLRVMLRDSLGPRLRELERVRVPPVEIRVRELDGRRTPRPLAYSFEVGARSVAGAEFAEINEGLAGYFETERGVLVLRVAPETPAARAGLQAGDVVVRAGGQPVQSVGELREAVARSRDRAVELRVVRKGQAREVELRWE